MHFPLNEPPNIPRVNEHNEGDKKGIKSIHNRLLLYYAVVLCKYVSVSNSFDQNSHQGCCEEQAYRVFNHETSLG